MWEQEGYGIVHFVTVEAADRAEARRKSGVRHPQSITEVA